MPDYSAGTAFLQIVPTLMGDKSAIQRQLDQAMTGVNTNVNVIPEIDQRKLADIQAALDRIPDEKVNVDVDDSAATAKLADLRARLDALKDKRIGVDVSAEQASAQLHGLQVELDRIGAEHPNVQVRADVAEASSQLSAVMAECDRIAAEHPNIQVSADTGAADAELAATNAEASRLDGRRVSFNVSDNGSASQSTSNISNLMAAGVALGPALIPVAAACAAALASIGGGAIAGIAGLGTLKLAFSGVGSALKDMGTAQDGAADSAQKSAAKQSSAADQVAAAQSRVQSAVASLHSAQENAAAANVRSSEQVQKAVESLAQARQQADTQAISSAQAVRDAEQRVADAQEQASRQIASALEAQRQAEQTLTNAVKDAQRAQQSLTQARQDAIRTLQNLQMQTEDGALAQKQAALDVQKAQQDLQKTLADPNADSLKRQQAQLTYDEAVQQLKDQQTRNGQLAQDKKQADAQGVEGSKQVQSALDGVSSANQRVQDAQNGVRDAATKVAQAQADGAKSVAKAQEAVTTAQRQATAQALSSANQIRSAEASLATAREGQAQQARSGAESVASAQRGVADAERSAATAGKQAGSGADSASAGAKKLADDMKKLSPAGREFVTFLNGLKPKFDELKNAAQSGLFPGLQAGITAALPRFGQLKDIVGNVASAMGGLARDAGKALNDPFWVNFFDFIKNTAGPSVDGLGRILGNVLKGVAGLIQSTGPVWQDLLRWLGDLARKFGDFGASAAGGGNKSFNGFMGYVKANLPMIKDIIANLGPAIGHLVEAIRPFGGLSLLGLDLFVKLIGALPPAVLTPIAGAIGSIVLAMKGMQAIKGIVEGFSAMSKVVKWMKDAEIGVKLMSAATKAWSIAQWLLNAAMDANPIVMIGLLIAGLVVGVIYAYTHFQWFKDIVDGAWSGIKGATVAVVNWFKGPFMDFWHGLGDDWNTFWAGVGKFFSDRWNDIKGAAVSIWNSIRDFFTGAWATFKGDWAAFWDWVGGKFSDAWNWIHDTGVSIWNHIHDFFAGAWNTFRDDWRAFWDWIGGKFADAWNWMHDTGVSIWNHIHDFFSGAWDTFKRDWGSVWDWVGGKFSDAWNGIKDTAGRIWGGIQNVVRDGVNGVIDGINWMVDKINAVLGLLSIPKIPMLPRLESGGVLTALEQGGTVPMYASGTSRIGGGFQTNGPQAIVGEGNPNYPEYVIPTDPKYRDRAVKLHGALSQDIGMPGAPMLAGGGVLGWLGNAASNVWGGITSAADAVGNKLSDIGSWVGDFGSTLMGDVTGAFRGFISNPFFQSIALGFAKKIGGGVQKKIEAAMAAMSGGATMGPMSASHTLDIVNAAKSKGVPHAGAVIAVMTGMQESGLRILANPSVPASMSLFHEGVGHDHDSVGIFQQRQSWGPTPLLMNPFGSAQLFFNKLGRGPYGNPGAEAQRVQVSAFPGAYSKWQGQAEGLVRGAGYEQGGKVGVPINTFDIPMGSTSYLPQGLSLAFNGTGAPEPLMRVPDGALGAAAAATGGAGGPTLNVYPTAGQSEESIGIAAARRLAWEGKVALG